MCAQDGLDELLAPTSGGATSGAAKTTSCVATTTSGSSAATRVLTQSTSSPRLEYDVAAALRTQSERVSHLWRVRVVTLGR